MIVFHKYEGKSLEQIKEECKKELNVTDEQIYFLQQETEKGLFKSKKVLLEVITEEEIINAIKLFISELSKNMNLEMNSEVKIQEGNIKIIIASNNNNILIGKDGKVLNSIQLLLRQAFSELNKLDLRIILDIGNYRAKKIKNLEYEIRSICNEVLTTKVDVKLDPMNSYERRIIHSIVSEYENLSSVSEGIEPLRYTIIKFKD